MMPASPTRELLRRLRAIRILLWGLGGSVVALACVVAPIAPIKAAEKTNADEGSRLFDNPQRVAIRGYDSDAMEPLITRDGRYLLFNNWNDPSVNTNLHYAERRDDLTFVYKGELAGVNTPALEGVPAMDKDQTFYFVSPRSYDKTYSTIYRGQFADGVVSNVELVPGISKKLPGIVNFDVEISPDGNTLYFVDSLFAGGMPVTADLVIAEKRGKSFERAPNSAAILKNVNSDVLEYAACISADGITLFFNRAGKGIPNVASIYVATRSSAKDPFGKPERLVALDGFVEGATLSPDERALYYHKKEGKKHVIYRARKG